jgi:RNAse (barnase) inhibitor barstar
MKNLIPSEIVLKESEESKEKTKAELQEILDSTELTEEEKNDKIKELLG